MYQPERGGVGVAKVFVDPQPTPNPNAMKFNVSVAVTSGKSESYSSKEQAQASPVARSLFALDGVSGVFMLNNFITVNKSADASWNDLVPDIVEAIESAFS